MPDNVVHLARPCASDCEHPGDWFIQSGHPACGATDMTIVLSPSLKAVTCRGCADDFVAMAIAAGRLVWETDIYDENVESPTYGKWVALYREADGGHMEVTP